MRERTRNTIIRFTFALEYYGNKILSSRLGTHIVEFIFCHMRNSCNVYDVLEKCIYQRNFSHQWNYDIDKEIDIDKVSKECVQLIYGKLNYSNSNIHKLITFLSEDSPKVPKISEPISCAKIQARQIHYSKKKEKNNNE